MAELAMILAAVQQHSSAQTSEHVQAHKGHNTLQIVQVFALLLLIRLQY